MSSPPTPIAPPLPLKVTRRELAAAVMAGSALSGLAADRLVNVVIGEIKTALVKGGVVELRGLGVFRTRMNKAYMATDPRNGGRVPVPARRRVAFVASTDLKGLLET